MKLEFTNLIVGNDETIKGGAGSIVFGHKLTPENVKKGLIIECIDDSDSYGYIHNGEEYMVYDFDLKNKTITIPYKGGWNMNRFIVK